MTNELTVLEALQTVIETELSDFLPSTKSDPEPEYGVVIDFPDVDQMPKKNMFYLQPDYAEFSNMAVQSDLSEFKISVFILCKRDSQENLTIKSYGYFKALYELLRTDISLNGTVDLTDIVDANFYPAVEGNPNVRGVEVSVSVRYTKDF